MNDTDKSELERLVHQAIVKNNLSGTIGELRDDILALITQRCNQARMDEVLTIAEYDEMKLLSPAMKKITDRYYELKHQAKETEGE